HAAGATTTKARRALRGAIHPLQLLERGHGPLVPLRSLSGFPPDPLQPHRQLPVCPLRHGSPPARNIIPETTAVQRDKQRLCPSPLRRAASSGWTPTTRQWHFQSCNSPEMEGQRIG